MTFTSREDALAAWDRVYATRPAWLDELKVEGIAWHLARVGEPGGGDEIMEAAEATLAPLVPAVNLPAIAADASDLAQYRQLADSALIWAQGLIITDAEGLGAAIAKLGEVVKVGKRADTARKDLARPAKDWLASLEACIAWVVGPVREAEKLLRDKVEKWQISERDRAAREQRDRDDAAKKAKAVADEADRKLADARAAAAQPPVEETGTLVDLFTQPERSEEAYRSGQPQSGTVDVEQAEADAESARRAAAQTAQVAAAPAAAPAKTVVVGDTTATMKTTMTYEVVDLAKVPRAFLVPDRAKIQAAIDAGAREIDGLRIFPKDTLAVGTKR